MSRISVRRVVVCTLAVLTAACEKKNDTQGYRPFDRFSASRTELSVHELSAAETTLPTTHFAGISGQPGQISAGRIFNRCGTKRVTCVVDGDTFWLARSKIRIADIDTPEVGQAKCAAEKRLGERATDRLVELLNEGAFELIGIGGRPQDQYGRELRVVVRNGRSLGAQLVAEGLARTWTGRREPWC